MNLPGCALKGKEQAVPYLGPFLLLLAHGYGASTLGHVERAGPQGG